MANWDDEWEALIEVCVGLPEWDQAGPDERALTVIETVEWDWPEATEATAADSTAWYYDAGAEELWKLVWEYGISSPSLRSKFEAALPLE